MSRKQALFVSAVLLAALSLVAGLILSAIARPRGVLPGSGGSTVTEAAHTGAYLSRLAVAGRISALGALVAALVLLFLFAPSETAAPALDGGPAAPAGPVREVSLAEEAAHVTAARLVRKLEAGAGGAGEAAALTGGDVPSGPLAAPGGVIPENVNAAPDMLALRDELQAEIGAYALAVGGIDAAIAVTDLQTGETISINGNVPHRTGCTIMMFALLAVVDEFQAGRASPYGLSSLIRRGIGGSFPPATRTFLASVFGDHMVGVQKARAMMTGWGMTTSFFHHVPFFFDEATYEPNILTALETDLVWQKLYRGEIFNAEWTAYTLGVLSDIDPWLNYMLPKYPTLAGATVAHKMGDHWDYDGWVNNDAGVVIFTGGDGTRKAYTITYLSQLARTEEIGYTLGANLSRTVWNFMAMKYGAQPVSAGPARPPVYQPPVYAPQPTAAPAPSPEPTAAATATPSPSQTPRPTGTPAPTLAPTPALTPAATIAPAQVPTPAPGGEP